MLTPSIVEGTAGPSTLLSWGFRMQFGHRHYWGQLQPAPAGFQWRLQAARGASIRGWPSPVWVGVRSSLWRSVLSWGSDL